MPTTNCKRHGPEAPGYGNPGARVRCKACNVAAVNKRRRRLKELAVAYKGGACADCGYRRSVWALDFHHQVPSEKSFSVSGSGTTKSWARIAAELDKCILLCRNCHAERHAREHEA